LFPGFSHRFRTSAPGIEGRHLARRIDGRHGTAGSILRAVWYDLRLIILVGALSVSLAIVVRYGLGYPIPLEHLVLTDRSRKILRYGFFLGPLILAGALVRRWWNLRQSNGLRVTPPADWLLAFRSLRDEGVVFRIVLSTITLLLMVALFSVFALWKASIVLISPWHWDPTLIGIERAIHGGVLPQELTRRWLGPGATGLLDRLYYLWFRVLALFIVWQSFRAPSQSRSRTLLAVVLVYTLLGNLAALVLSSGGPVYYSRLVGWPDPYADQAGYLAAIPGLRAVEVQASIWHWLLADTYVPFGSISAMPSMHVAAVTVIALACWERNRWLGGAAWFYVLLILVASVHLNWHYAIDGYAAILGTLGVWWLSGRLVRRYR
jgi:hypothetical protein